MSRYFFHFEHGSEVRDEEGEDFRAFDDAKRHAVQVIAESLWKSPDKFWNAKAYRVTVTDDHNLSLFTIEMIATFSPSVRAEARDEAPR